MAAMTTFLPGDRVRHRHAGIGTAIPHGPEEAGFMGVTRVNMDREEIPDGLYFADTVLLLAGTRCIPFARMTAQQMRDHLTIAHGWPGWSTQPADPDSTTAQIRMVTIHVTAELLDQYGISASPVPHTHRKATP